MSEENKSPIYDQTTCILPAQTRGIHLITNNIQASMNDLPTIQMGLVHLFLQHTSASLLISEKACEDVRLDLETHLNRLVPEDEQLYRHTIEGADDMPAHIKNALLGSSLTIPIMAGKMALGQWQGIFLCEHRNRATSRSIIVTVQGMTKTFSTNH